jgi:hypothetical protein
VTKPLAVYVVYDRESGEVMHVHTEPAGFETSEEEVLQMAVLDPGGKWAVLPLREGELPSHPVRVEDGQLREAKGDAARAGGGLASGSIDPAIERRYERVRPPNPRLSNE